MSKLPVPQTVEGIAQLATRLRKVRHQRGSRTHGWGTSGQHRGSGMQGGFGKAGRFRHKKSRVIRTTGTSRIGSKGFVSVAQKKSLGQTLNLSQLSDMIDKLVSEKKVQFENQKAVIDLSQLGFRKLLGMGSISHAVQVKVDQCSEQALRKIKEAGGEAILKTSGGST